MVSNESRLIFRIGGHYYFRNHDNSQTYANGRGWLFCITPGGVRRWKLVNEDIPSSLESRVIYSTSGRNVIYAEGGVKPEIVDSCDVSLNCQSLGKLMYDYKLKEAKETLTWSEVNTWNSNEEQQVVDKLQNDDWEDRYLKFLNAELERVADCEQQKDYVSGVCAEIERVELEKEERQMKSIVRAEVREKDEIRVKIEDLSL